MSRSTIIVSLAFVFAAATLPNAPAFALGEMCAPGAVIRVEVADSQAKRELGLMYRTALARHAGMVFVFDRDQPVSFWMKNTLIPLDMVFIGGDARVRSVAANVPASTLKTPDNRVARRGGRAKYVLELNAGEAALDGLSPGKSVSIRLQTSPH